MNLEKELIHGMKMLIDNHGPTDWIEREVLANCKFWSEHYGEVIGKRVHAESVRYLKLKKNGSK